MCKSVIGQIDAELTTKERESVEVVEKKMRAWCDNSKGKDKTMCYYMGVGDAEMGRHGWPGYTPHAWLIRNDDGRMWNNDVCIQTPTNNE